MLSLEECEPNRPPRSQNEPLASGTVKLEIIIGRFSTVTSANHTICRGSSHSLRIASSTIITMSRRLAVLVLGEFGDRHVLHRKRGVGAVEGGHRHPRDFRKTKIVRRRLLRSVDQLVAIDDLQEAALVGAVAEIDAVALRPGRDRPVHLGRHRAGRARLLAGKAEVADFHGMRGIAEVVDLGHAAGAPVRRARDQKGDAGFAFPPVLVGVLQAAEPGDQNRIGGIGDIPDLMGFAAEGAQHVDRVAIALRQRLAVADAHHLRAAGLVCAFLARECGADISDARDR